MSSPFEELAELDRLIHEPARLAILTALSSCRSADFLYLQRLTGLTKGNLSTHLAKLEQARLIVITKGYVGKVPNTSVSITADGNAELKAHWKSLAQLRKRSLEWQPE